MRVAPECCYWNYRELCWYYYSLDRDTIRPLESLSSTAGIIISQSGEKEPPLTGADVGSQLPDAKKKTHSDIMLLWRLFLGDCWRLFSFHAALEDFPFVVWNRRRRSSKGVSIKLKQKKGHSRKSYVCMRVYGLLTLISIFMGKEMIKRLGESGPKRKVSYKNKLFMWGASGSCIAIKGNTIT